MQAEYSGKGANVLAPTSPASPTPSGSAAAHRVARRYRLDERLGRGGCSEVWRGYDEVLARAVAVKLSTGPTDGTTAANFQREAQTLARLEHRNVVAVYDIGVDGGVAFEVMELLPGPSLSGILAQRGPLPIDDALRLSADAAFGLSAVHAAGIVHGDVKPANLVLATDGSVHLIDFGIARIGPVATPDAQCPVMGTPEFLSPEAVAGLPCDGRADLYGLGCVLFALLTDTPPFRGEDSAATLRLHLSAPVPDVRDRRADIPEPVADLVSQLLAKDPASRPAPAFEVGRRLLQLRQAPRTCERKPPPGRLVARTVCTTPLAPAPFPPPPAGAARAAQAAAAAPAAALPPPPAKKKGRARRGSRRTRILGRVASAVLVMALAAGVVAASVGRPSSPRNSPPGHHLTSAVSPGGTSSSSPPAASSSPPPTTTTTAPPGPPPTPEQEVADGRAALEQLASENVVDPSTIGALRNLFEQIDGDIVVGDNQAAADDTAELLSDLSALESSGQVTLSEITPITSPLDALAGMLPVPDQ